MIPGRYIIEWKENAPWPNDGQVEQDLVFLYYVLTNMDVDTDKVLEAYKKYMAFSVDQPPSQKEFLRNMEQKKEDPACGGDIYALLRPGIKYDQQTAFELIRTEIIEKI